MRLLSAIGRFIGGPGQQIAREITAQGRGPYQYPARVELNGVSVTLRPLEAADREGIVAFARALPEHDLLFLRRDITDPKEVDLWIRDVEEDRYSTVLAIVDDAVVGYATVASDGLTWTRHLGEIRILVATEMRAIHLGRVLTEQAFGLAMQRGVTKMIAQMTTDQDAAIAVFTRMGSKTEAVLKRHVLDREGFPHDLQVMALDVNEFQAKVDLLWVQASGEVPGL